MVSNTSLRKTNMEPENIQILEKDGKGETSTKQLFFWVLYVKFGEMIQFHGCLLQMGWIATTNYSEDPAGDPYEIFWPHFFSKVHRLRSSKNSEKEDKKDTINWTWNKREDFKIKIMEIYRYVEMRSKVVQGLGCFFLWVDGWMVRARFLLWQIQV